jgi:hypothetical protein
VAVSGVAGLNWQYVRAVVVGAPGIGFTTTVVLLVPVHPSALAVTVYVPAAEDPTPVIVGFCTFELKPLGPVQAYVAPANDVAVKFRLVPSQTGVLLPAVMAGAGLITTVVLPGAEVQLFTVTVTEYTPALATIAVAIVGF